MRQEQVSQFQQTVWGYYRAHKRRMPWRETPTPYYVLVSEIMLQQTQVPRVLAKFAEFITRFPDAQSVASAPLGDVLAAWSGLGYNRRAKFLWEAARRVGDGQLPKTTEGLAALPGIGPNTAGAIVAYAYNQPAIFVETNIRTVIIHHFFADHPEKVTDAQIRDIVAQTLPPDNPREWYWALMDYGAYLKVTAGAQLHKVHNYRPQGKFEGSRRQIRGMVLRLLVDGTHTNGQLAAQIPDNRLEAVLADLQGEGLIAQTGSSWHLTA